MAKNRKFKRNPVVEKYPIVNFREELRTLPDRLPEGKVVYIYTRHRTEYTMTYAQFYENIKYFGTALSLLGLAGKPIAVIGETAPYYMTAYYAVVSTGGIIVPIDREIADDETVAFMKSAGVEAVVYGETQNKRMKDIAASGKGPGLFIPVYPEEDEEPGEGFTTFDSLLEMGKKAVESGNDFFETCPQDLEKCCTIIFTSGTTGTGKGVMLCQRNLIATVMASVDIIYQVDYTTKLLSVLPLHHTYEVATGQMGAHFYGMTIAINDSLKYVSRNIKKYKPTYLTLVPLFVETMHKKMWEEVRKQGKEKKVRFAMKMSNILLFFGIDRRRKIFRELLEAYGGELTSLVSGGARLNPQCLKDFRAIGIDVQEGYGITECSPLVAASPVDRVKPGSVGPAVRGVTVKIDGQTKPGMTGEILVKGDNVMLGYLNNEEATREAFTEDGFYRTGDIGYIDKDGYIFITGRKKNIIILSNGKNIYPEELEEHLASCPLFLESAVVGREKEEGVVITAVIYPDYTKLQGKTDEEIEKEVRDQLNEINRTLPQYKQIRGLEIRKTEFEKTSSRKIKRYKI